MNARRIQGFTLLEVLIAVLVLSIGLLGLAGLQATGLQNNHSAYLRTQATVRAYDIADRMRANPQGLANGNYNNGVAAVNTACTSSAGCTPAEMAGNDLADWNADNAAWLPSGGGLVCVDQVVAPAPPEPLNAPVCDGLGNVYVIYVWWDDAHNGVPDTRFVTSFQP